MNTYKNNNLFWKSMILKIILYAVRISALITILLIFINRIFMSDKKIIFTYSEITLLLIVIVLFIISELIHYVIMCFSLYGETANVINYMYFPKVKLKTIKNMKMNKDFKGHTFFLNKSFKSKKIKINHKKYEK